MNKYPILKLGDLCLFENGDRGVNYPSEKDFISIGIPFINSKHISNNRVDFNNVNFISQIKYDSLRSGKIRKNDILYCLRGSLGKNALVDFEKGAIASAFVIIRPKEHNDYKYIYYALNSKTVANQVKNIDNGSVQGNLSVLNIKEFQFPIPNITHQKKIVKILSDLDSKIQINNNINQELEAMAKTLYDYWFVQFDFPDINGGPYKSYGGEMVFNEELKREIPEGWEVNKLGDILKTELGGTPATKVRAFWEGEIPWLNSGEIANFPIIESEEKVTEEAISNSATSLMPKGSCVLSITRHLRPSILGIDACANQSVVGILESGKLKSSYIYPYLVNEIPRLMKLRTGALQPHINKKTVDASLIINPVTDVLNDYYKIANPIYDQIVNNSLQNQKLSELRDWLLPMLMNGQVSVGEAEKEVAALGLVAEGDVKYGKE
jgi:type I restriction enzyme S subunit